MSCIQQIRSVTVNKVPVSAYIQSKSHFRSHCSTSLDSSLITRRVLGPTTTSSDTSQKGPGTRTSDWNHTFITDLLGFEGTTPTPPRVSFRSYFLLFWTQACQWSRGVSIKQKLTQRRTVPQLFADVLLLECPRVGHTHLKPWQHPTWHQQTFTRWYDLLTWPHNSHRHFSTQWSTLSREPTAPAM